MSNSISVHETVILFPGSRAVAREREQLDAVTAELQAALTHEKALREEICELFQRQDTLAQEFEHRLVNGLKVIVSLLLLQSRTATTPEAAEQLSVAARRVAAVGRMHCRRHLLDQ
jgi:two-component system, sensor histidine kinase PdtaS